MRTKGVNEKCLLTNPDFDEKPGFYAYQTLCAVWQPDYKPNKIKYDIEVVDEGIFYGISEDDAFPSVPLIATFTDKNGNDLVAWWLPWNMQENISKLATINISLEGIQFDDPVLVDLLTGNVYEPGEKVSNQNKNCLIKEIGLADYPMVLVERNTINFK